MEDDAEEEEQEQVNPKFEYRTARYGTHDDMEIDLNKQAKAGFEPTHYATWSQQQYGADHFVIYRRALPEEKSS